jgi:uncharacterized alpha-E superfamily protein
MILTFLAIIPATPRSLRAQTPQELQAELQEMKHLYEQKIATLEQNRSGRWGLRAWEFSSG